MQKIAPLELHQHLGKKVKGFSTQEGNKLGVQKSEMRNAIQERQARSIYVNSFCFVRFTPLIFPLSKNIGGQR